MSYKRELFVLDVLLKQPVVVLIASFMLVSCSDMKILTTNEIIIGNWEMVNLDELNTLTEIQGEEFFVGPGSKPFDPITRLSIIYNIDGTGFWEVEYEVQAIYRRKFSYEFVSTDEYQLVKQNDNTVYKYRVLKSEPNILTFLLIGALVDGKEQKNFEKLYTPIAHTFVRKFNKI